MKTRIQKTLLKWFPEAFVESPFSNEYEILNAFAQSLLRLTEDEKNKKSEHFKIINLLYVNGNLHDRNAIENEFLAYLANHETKESFQQHLTLMPTAVKSAYIKTIVQN